MSAKVFSLVLEYPFSHTQKAVMLALANQCNDFGQHCFPSFELIQRHTSLGRRTIFDALAQLEESGFISRLQIRNSQRVEFRLHIEALQQPNLPGLEPEDPAGKRVKPTSAAAAPVQEAHQCESRTSAGDSKTGAGGAPTGAGAALYKAPVIYPKAPKGEARSPAGSRLPLDWQPSEAEIAFAKSARPDLDWKAEAEKFGDYWHGLAGAAARKVDWTATWRNWIRRAQASKPAANGQGAAPTPAAAPSEPRDWRKPSENALQHRLSYLRQQHGYGAFGEGEEGEREYERLCAEARAQHGAAAPAEQQSEAAA